MTAVCLVHGSRVVIQFTVDYLVLQTFALTLVTFMLG